MKPIYYFFMGMMAGIAIFGVEFICIISIHKVIDRFRRMDEMERELEKLKCRQRIIEGRLSDWSRIKQRLDSGLPL